MSKQKKSYDYLLSLYSRVEEALSDESIEPENVPEILVTFCIVVERILKIKLHSKNPVLVFDTAKIKDDSTLGAIILKKEGDINTIKITQVIDRFRVVFKKIFSHDELQALIDIYQIRNNFIHGYKAENQLSLDHEDAVKKMGTIWEKIIPMATTLFGKNAIKHSKPKKKYSQEDLESLLVEQVKEKIKSAGYRTGLFVSDYGIDEGFTNMVYTTAAGYSWGQEKCPRCHSLSLSLEKVDPSDLYNSMYIKYGNLLDQYVPKSGSGLYKCSKCHLELTSREYEIAKSL